MQTGKEKTHTQTFPHCTYLIEQRSMGALERSSIQSGRAELVLTCRRARPGMGQRRLKHVTCHGVGAGALGRNACGQAGVAH